jgi:hypothetical protein
MWMPGGVGNPDKALPEGLFSHTKGLEGCWLFHQVGQGNKYSLYTFLGILPCWIINLQQQLKFHSQVVGVYQKLNCTTQAFKFTPLSWWMMQCSAILSSLKAVGLIQYLLDFFFYNWQPFF